MIPRRFLWLFDLTIICIAFLISYALSPYLYIGLSYMPVEIHKILSLPQEIVTTGGPISIVDQMVNAKDVLPEKRELFWILLTMIPAVILSLEMLGEYSVEFLHQTGARILMKASFSSLVGLGLVLLVMFAFKVEDISRLFVFAFTFLCSLGLANTRIVLRWGLKKGFYSKNILVLGSTPGIKWMVQYFNKNIAQTEYRLFGYLSINPSQMSTKENDIQLKYLGRVKDLAKILVNRPISEVIAIQPPSEGEWLKFVIDDCDFFRTTLRIVPEELLYKTMTDLNIRYRNEILRLPAVVLMPPDFDTDLLFIKRLIDIVVSGVLLILLSPLFLIVSIAIKMTTPDLPVFYPWHVIGQNGIEFVGYKFTTMYADADKRKKELMSKNEMIGPVFKIKKDPRVTPLGYFLRKFSINELPQLWSVLKGDMSMVGPRPAFRQELERYELWQKRKLCVRPGITCLWQVSGRNEISNFDEWVRLDLEYIDHWSLWLDFRIMLRTIWVVIAGSGC